MKDGAPKLAPTATRVDRHQEKRVQTANAAASGHSAPRTDAGSQENDLELEEQHSLEEPPLEDDLSPRSSNRRASSPSAARSTSSLHERRTLRYLTWSTYSLLVFATIWGVLARLGLLWIGSFARGQVFALVWAQAVGCVVMGIVTERKKGLERVYAPFFVACGTGFCGSLTTFSSWMHDVFVAFANVDQPELGRFNAFSSGLALTVVTLALSTTSLRLGVHLSSSLPTHLLPSLTLRHSLPTHLLTILLGPLFYLGSILLLILGPSSWRHRATFAIVLGPPGTLLRYFFSRRLNPIYPSLPLGTLAANLLACLLFAVFSILQRREGISPLGCSALQGALDGFCGSLSTVSTFVVELRGLKRGESWRYFTTSWAAGQLLFVVVLGSWLWSGDRGAVCAA